MDCNNSGFKMFMKMYAAQILEITQLFQFNIVNKVANIFA